MNKLIQGGGSWIMLLFNFEGVCVCVCRGRGLAVNDNHCIYVCPPKEGLEMHLVITVIGWVDG